MGGPAPASQDPNANNENNPRKENGGVPADRKMDVASWCQRRELGFQPGKINAALNQAAEDSFVSKKIFHERLCDVPGTPRSTFLIVFSPDGTKVASTHGNHDVYISELSSGKHLKILSGHPRTPWCITFHPSHTQVLASGCLGGQVRVWDLAGGSEVWHVKGTSVASIAFHPRDHLLVIAASNELHFWDWSHPQPFKCVKTNNISSKIRFVAFDSLGHKLITGISCWSQNNTSSNSVLELLPYLPSDSATAANLSNTLASVRDQMPPSYHNLIHRYDNLVRNYHRMIMARSQSSATIDRGTDPMETDWNSTADPSEGLLSSIPQRTVTTDSFTQTANSLLRRNRLMLEPAFGNPVYNLFSGRLSRTPDLQPSSSTNMYVGPVTQERFNVLDNHDENINYNILHEVTRNMPPMSAQRQTSNSNRSMKAAYLNRLQNVLEIFIDQTLYSWERCDTNCFLPSSAVSGVRTNTQGVSANNVTSTRRNDDNESSSDSNQPQTYANPLQRNSVINFHGSNRAESNQNDRNINSETTRSLNNIQSMLRNSGDILINSIRTLRCFSTRLRMYRNRIRGNSSESQAERQNTPSETMDRIEEYLDRRNASIRNPERSEQSTTPVESGSIETTDSGGERLSVIDNRLRNSDEILINSLTTLRNFKERLRVLQNEQNDEPVSSTSNPQTNNTNMECTDDPPPVADDNVPQCSKNVTNESDIKIPNNNINLENNSQNNFQNMPSCSSSSSQEGPSSTSQVPESDLNVPSTSGYRPSFNSVKNNRKTPKVKPLNVSDEPFERVERGVRMIVNLNQDLLSLWTQLLATRRDPSLRTLRAIWETMRRDIMRLNSNTNQNEPSNCYSISVARLNALDGIFTRPPNSNDSNANNTAGQKRSLSNISKNKLPSYTKTYSPDKKICKRRTKSASSILSQTLNVANVNLNNPSTSQTNCPSSSNGTGSVSGSSSSTSAQPNPDELMDHEYSYPRPRSRPLRRLLRPQLNRNLDARNRAGTNHRRTELEITRDVIRLRARKVVSTMLGIMMCCLDSNQMHNQLVILVKTLKKALTVTCLMLMVNLFSSESQAQNPPVRNNNVTQDSSSPQPNSLASDPRPSNIPNNNVPNQTTNNAETPVNESNRSNTQRHERGSPPHLRRIRNHASFYVRRRMSLPSRNLQQLLSDSHKSLRTSSNPANRPSTSRVNRPSTSRNQDVTPSENVTSPNNLRSAPAASNVPPQTQPPRTRPPQSARSNLFRSHLSRPCFFRRLLCSQGFVSETLRQANRPVAFSNNVGRESAGLRALLSRLERSTRRARTGAQAQPSNSATNNVSVPVVQVNDVPIDMQNADPPPTVNAPRVSDQRPELQNVFSMEDIIYDNRWTATIRFSSEPTQTYRIQAWDFTNGELPDISDINKNVVVRECKIHNDANIDISRDGRLLVSLLLTHRIGTTLNVLGIFSLEWHNLGDCLFTTYMEQNAVSVSLSPCARHLAVGLGSKRVSLVPYGQNGVMAIIFRLDQSKEKSKDKIPCPRPLHPIRRLEHNFQESGFTSMNCLKWAPQPGQGLVYANSIGQLKILS